jgi:LysM repeat protein
MATDNLVLGTFTFEIDDLPDNIPLGGEQMLSVTKFPGGYKDIQSFGAFDDTITLTGTLNYKNASSKAATLEKMWKSGNTYPFKIGSFKTMSVVVKNFKYTYQSLYNIAYSLDLEVVPSGAESTFSTMSTSSSFGGTSSKVTTSQPKSNTPSPQRSYVVKSGDSLWKIAKMYYGNGSLYSKIATANKLKSSLITPGQKLVIP